MNSELMLECLAIGSLPQKNLQDAVKLVKENFKKIPFWSQLVKISKNEDMIVQFLENMPSLCFDGEKIFLETESEKFFQDLEIFFADYEEISKNLAAVEKYAINNSLFFNEFIKIIKELKANYAKGQIVGPFTLSTTLVDINGKYAFYDDTLREIIVKTLTLKALWQIYKIKQVNSEITPIIFIDEPSISQLGTSAYITVSKNEVINMITEISDAIKNAGALSAVHCCGKCDWSIPIKSGVNMINLDAYSYAQSLSLFADDIKKFLANGGKIAWGIVPTLDKEALEKADLEDMVNVFDKAVKYLTQKGIDEKIIIKNSLITPSCGAGALSENLAKKAMVLTKNLSESLKERYYDI